MTQETIAPGSWRIHLLVTGGVLFTVLLALLLAQLDSLQRQILPSPVAQAIANLNATPTSTLLPAIPMATGTPTPPARDRLTNADTDTDTAVAVLPTCATTTPGWSLTPLSPDETLLALSLRYNISEEKIRLANCLAPGSLVNATALYLPGTAATPVPVADCGPPQDWELYTVLRGENMFRLSLRYGTTINAILNANCLTSTSIQAGQRLYLPPRVVLPPTPRPTATATSTATAMGTATNTATSTVPPLPTVSATATSTATGTATGTATATASSTTAASVTATVTHTPDASPTMSPTASETPSNTPTPSPTSSATPTASATPSPSPTHSPTPSGTPTVTATPTATATETAVP